MSFLKPSFKKGATDSVSEFRKSLANWFQKDGRHFPWTGISDPYAILVSEVMLQQTQVGTVLKKGYYTRFMAKFPDVESLAQAEDDELLKAWEGLGYYRRARMLRDTAVCVVRDWDGIFPREFDELLTLPGVGQYTASALAAFAFGKVSPLVDGNVSRILARIFDDDRVIEKATVVRDFRERSSELCDPQNPARHHAAMMQLGQMICRPGVPHCVLCPVATFCETRSPQSLPKKKPKAKITEVIEQAIFFKNDKGEILLHQEQGKRRTGFWRLPLRDADEVANLPLLTSFSYTITRYKVQLSVFQADSADLAVGHQWVSADEIEALAIAAPFRKALRLIEELDKS